MAMPMPESKLKITRRVFLIAPEMQGSIVLRVVVLTVAFAGLVILGLAWSYSQLSALPVDEEVRRRFSEAAIITAGVAVLMLIALGCYFIVLTHRIAGPAYRIRKAIVNLSEGRTEDRVRLREGDYLQDLAAATNQLAEAMEEGRRSREGAVRRIEMLRDLIEAGHGGSEKARELLEALRRDVEQIR